MHLYIKKTEESAGGYTRYDLLADVQFCAHTGQYFSGDCGIYSTVNMVFLIIIFALLLRVFLLTIKISQMEHRVSILVEELAIREKDSRKAKQKKWIRPEMKILDLKEQQTEHSEK